MLRSYVRVFRTGVCGRPTEGFVAANDGVGNRPWYVYRRDRDGMTEVLCNVRGRTLRFASRKAATGRAGVQNQVSEPVAEVLWWV